MHAALASQQPAQLPGPQASEPGDPEPDGAAFVRPDLMPSMRHAADSAEIDVATNFVVVAVTQLVNARRHAILPSAFFVHAESIASSTSSPNGKRAESETRSLRRSEERRLAPLAADQRARLAVVVGELLLRLRLFRCAEALPDARERIAVA